DPEDRGSQLGRTSELSGPGRAGAEDGDLRIPPLRRGGLAKEGHDGRAVHDELAGYHVRLLHVHPPTARSATGPPARRGARVRRSPQPKAARSAFPSGTPQPVTASNPGPAA